MKHLLIFAVLLFTFCVSAVEYDLEVKTDKKHWALKAGEKVTFSFVLRSREDKKAPFQVVKGRKVTYEIMGDGGMKNVKKQFVTGEKPFTVVSSINGPGWLCINFIVREQNGRPTFVLKKNRKVMLEKGIGVLYEPEKIIPGQPEPKDFDAFWKAQRALLDKVPLKAKRTSVPAPAAYKGNNFWDVQIDCAGGMPVSGYLCIPAGAKPKSLPAIVTFHGAGVRSASPSAYGRSIHLDINAHGIPNGKPKDFYEELRNNSLKNYRFSGMDKRETVYFKGMYLRLMRALDYVKSLPEWNGKVLVVYGASQGGGQAIAAAALDPRVSLCVAGVPAIGDHAGSIAAFPRRPGWPKFYDGRRAKPDQKVVDATAYYDNVFFARRIKCETYMTAGLVDMSCSPAGVYMFYNNLAAKKKDLHVFPGGTHGGAPCTRGTDRISAVLQGK
ncbi:MAG: acetylxylan esterase [Lentisphaeria bacterium]|nr:acetylxylan esterase [Lentisphaeria bacterium]